jgi:hypothetical protein
VLTGNSFVGYPAKSFYDDWPADTEPADSFYWYVNVPDGQINGAEGHLDGRDNSFEGVAVAAMTGPQYVALQDMVLDRHDNGSYGLLVLADVGVVTASLNPCDPDAYIDLSATVSPPTAGLTVSFLVDGGAPAGAAGEPAGNAVTNNSGVATLENYKAAMGQGSYTIIASHGGSSDTATLTVTGNPGEAVSPIDVSGPATATAGVPETYTAEATDAYGTTWDATGEVTADSGWSDSPSADGSWAGNVYTPKKAGPHHVTAKLDDAEGATAVTVVHGPATGLTVDATHSVAAPGGIVTFSAFAEDDFDNDWPVTGTATFADNPTNGTFLANVYTAGGAGAVDVTATLGGLVSDPFSLTVVGAAPTPGDALQFNPANKWFELKDAAALTTRDVVNTGWYPLGGGTGAEIWIVVTSENTRGVHTASTATITRFDPDGVAGPQPDVAIGAVNTLRVAFAMGTPTVFRTIRQASTVDVSIKLGNYARRGNNTLITEMIADPVFPDGKMPGFWLRTVTVFDDNTIGQAYELGTLP